MKTIYNTIEALELAISNSNNQYKTKDLKDQLSWMKAREKGQFVTKAHLTELKPLIIFVINKSLYFKPIGVKEVMTELLADVENNSIVFRTEKGIKGLVCDRVKFICKEFNTNYVAKVVGEEVWTNSGLRAEDSLYAKVQSFNLNMLMN